MDTNAVEQRERGGVDLAALSEREREVLDLALAGLSAAAIADRLTLTQATIRSHLARIYAKAGVGGRVELLAQLNGRLGGPVSPPASPPIEPAPMEPAPSQLAAIPPAPMEPEPIQPAPPRRRRALPIAIALAVTLSILGAGALFLWLRPDLPPSTNLAAVSQLVDRGQATTLDLRGDTLFVTTADGRHYRVDGVGQAAWAEIASRVEANPGAPVEISISRADTLTPGSILGIVSAFAPLIVLLAIALVAFRRLRRPPRLSPAS